MSTPQIIKDSKLISLDTKYASEKLNGSYKSYVRFNFLDINIPNNYTALVSLKEFNAPNSFFNINEYNNTLSTTIGEGDASTIGSTMVLPGNYNMRTMAEYLNSYTPFTVTYDVPSLTFTFACNKEFLIHKEGTLNSVLGFDNDQDYISSDKFLQNPYPCDFYGYKSIGFICKNLITDNIRNSAEDALLAEIPILSRDLITYSDGYKGAYLGNSLSEVVIEIKDPDNNYVNFRNKNWSFTLLVDFVEDLPGFDTDKHSLYNAQKRFHLGYTDGEQLVQEERPHYIR